MISTILEGSMELDKIKLQKEFNFQEWLGLSNEEKRYIYKHIWNPASLEIGAKTQREILNNFRQSLSIPDEDIISLQYGYFGACVGAIHIILNKPHKIPSHFAWLPVNKGILHGEKIRWRWTL